MALSEFPDTRSVRDDQRQRQSKVASLNADATTVVFADIVGSTALYEALGNERAAMAVTEVLDWMTGRIHQGGGRVVKSLGDGVLGIFSHPSVAVRSMLQIMLEQRERIVQPVHAINPELRVGVASGEVLEVAGDCYGDAVNMAARLCERAGVGEIWATEAVVHATSEIANTRFVRLGHFTVRGKADPMLMYQVEWHDEESEEQPTQRAGLTELADLGAAAASQIALSWGPDQISCSAEQVPIYVGRSVDAHLHVQDPRVSRVHARIDWRDGAFELTDLSSYGTWVRFEGSQTPIQLRRDSCILHGNGELALSLPFTAAEAPRIAFHVTGKSLRLG